MDANTYQVTLARLSRERDHGHTAVGPRVEQAAVLYARWKGMGDDPDYLRVSYKDKLDRMIATMHPEEWSALESVIPVLGEAVFKGLLQYAMDRVNAAARERHKAARCRTAQHRRSR